MDGQHLRGHRPRRELVILTAQKQEVETSLVTLDGSITKSKYPPLKRKKFDKVFCDKIMHFVMLLVKT